MEASKLPIDRAWIEQALIPYLRHAFSHILPNDADIKPVVWNAIKFCMRKPDHESDANDLIFERILQAIANRHLNLAPDLVIVTENLEALAKYLIRRSQLKGPYALLERIDIANDQAAGYEKKRKHIESASEGEEDDCVPVPLPPKPKAKAAPTDENIDPRLILAQPGEFTSPTRRDVLTVTEEEFYRSQVRMFNYHRQYNTIMPTWNQQSQIATAQNVQNHASYQIPGRGWAHGQQSTYNPPPEQSRMTSYVRYLGLRQSPSTSQPTYGESHLSQGSEIPATIQERIARPYPTVNQAFPQQMDTHPTENAPYPPQGTVRPPQSGRYQPRTWDQAAYQHTQDMIEFPIHEQFQNTPNFYPNQEYSQCQTHQGSQPVPVHSAYRPPRAQQPLQPQRATPQQPHHSRAQPENQERGDHPGYPNIHGEFPATPYAGANGNER